MVGLCALRRSKGCGETLELWPCCQSACPNGNAIGPADCALLFHNCSVDPGAVRYAEISGAQVAFQVTGEGPVDFVYMLGIGSNFQSWWDFPPWAEVLERIATFARLVLFDRRGSGISDGLPPGGLSTWEAHTEDLRTVLDAIESKGAVLMACFDAGPVALTFAATYPDRIRGLVLWNSYARFMSDDGYPFGPSRSDVDIFNNRLRTMWGTEELVRYLYVNELRDEHVRALANQMRGACTPASYTRQNMLMTGADARAALPLIQTPVLVFSTNAPSIPSDLGRYVAQHVTHGTFVGLDGSEQGLFARKDRQEILDQLEEFTTGAKACRSNRVLAGLLFSDIVGSTRHVAELGDHRWHGRLDSHDRIVQSVVDSWKGRLVKFTGDGVLATFDGPGRSLQAALEIRAALQSVGIDIRAGVHFGEVEVRNDGDIGGIGVHLAARTMGAAVDGEIWCTRTVKDLALGSGLIFEDRGTHELKGVPETWPLYAVNLPE